MKTNIEKNNTFILLFIITIIPLLFIMCLTYSGVEGLYRQEPQNIASVSEQLQDYNTEEYNRIYENPFLKVMENPLSTFSIDVDTASYSNTRRFLNQGEMPPEDAVRIEELINYFTYDYPEPEQGQPFAFYTELSACPWNEKNKLLHIGLQARKVSFEKLPPNNLVFLLDVSGSMTDYNKLPLLKSAIKLLVNEMRNIDNIAIVVYAGAAGLVLPPIGGDEKQKIIQAIDNLQAGGSTAGGAGIQLAYKVALENYNPQANNRIILATDGDFNVGPSSEGELIRMIEEKRDQGIFLTVLGFGMGNLKDSKMESLADKGNGNYAYIDSNLEAKKVLVNEMGGTLLTIAKDVKIQVEFNPVFIDSYRLLGYENRLLRAEDFEDDTKDAGELGAGHTVTVLYELAPATGNINDKNDSRYLSTEIKDQALTANELMQIKFRYKRPLGTESELIVQPIIYNEIPLFQSTDNFRFAAAVAEFGLLLRNSRYKANSNYNHVIELASDALGDDTEGYRKEFIKLVKLASDLDYR